jgi:hypothetical protein
LFNINYSAKCPIILEILEKIKQTIDRKNHNSRFAKTHAIRGGFILYHLFSHAQLLLEALPIFIVLKAQY